MIVVCNRRHKQHSDAYKPHNAIIKDSHQNNQGNVPN